MCGIFAAYHYRSRLRVSRHSVAQSTELLRHRGPDGFGYHLDAHLGLGHARLAIIDREAGNLPIFSEDKTCVAVVNGEIYNFKELQKILYSRGHVLASQSDSEVIVHLWEEFGTDCLNYLHGDFAFALYDSDKQVLFAARDPLGVKPLFMTETLDGLVLASEEKALLAYPGVSREVDRLAVQDYFLAGLVAAPRTFFSQIKSLSPGHFLLCAESSLQVTQYWNIPFRDTASNEEIRKAIQEAVEQRMQSEVPVGAGLSGGIDSGTIAAFGTSYLKAKDAQRLSTFSLRYESNTAHFKAKPNLAIGNMLSDDAEFSLSLADHLHTEHHELTLEVEAIFETLDRIIWHRDRPLHTFTEYGHYHLARFAKNFVTVLLSGEGGDEVFSGYYYWLWRRTESNTRFYPWMWRPSNKIAEFENAVSVYDLFANLLKPEFSVYSEVQARQQAEFDAQIAQPATDDFINKLGYLFVKLHMPEFLAIEDRLGLAAGVEIRVPFADPRVIAMVAGLPSSRKIGPHGEKLLLQQLTQKLLPDEIRLRKKSAFPIPLNLDSFYCEVEKILSQTHLGLHQFIDKQRLGRFLERHRTKSTTATRHVLFRLYTFERWLTLSSL